MTPLVHHVPPAISAADVVPMTHTHADRLRQIAHEMIALADAMAGAKAVPVVESPDKDELISMGDAATLLGIRYDAVRMRAKRARVTVKLGAASYVWRAWASEQAKVRSVRSNCSDVRSLSKFAVPSDNRSNDEEVDVFPARDRAKNRGRFDGS